jgi:hypothetical protein
MTLQYAEIIASASLPESTEELTEGFGFAVLSSKVL